MNVYPMLDKQGKPAAFTGLEIVGKHIGKAGNKAIAALRAYNADVTYDGNGKPNGHIVTYGYFMPLPNGLAVRPAFTVTFRGNGYTLPPMFKQGETVMPELDGKFWTGNPADVRFTLRVTGQEAIGLPAKGGRESGKTGQTVYRYALLDSDGKTAYALGFSGGLEVTISGNLTYGKPAESGKVIRPMFEGEREDEGAEQLGYKPAAEQPNDKPAADKPNGKPAEQPNGKQPALAGK